MDNGVISVTIPATDISGLATAADLSPLATTAQLSPLATTAQLSPLATTADLSGLATTVYGNTICASALSALITVPAVAADLDFPSVTVAGIPDGATLIKVIPNLLVARIVDSSTAENKINAASKTIRVKLAAGAWGTDDIVAFTLAQNSLLTPASSGRGGISFVGEDIKSEVTGNGTYNFRSEETNRSDAIVAAGASLLLYDVQIVLRVEYSVG